MSYTKLFRVPDYYPRFTCKCGSCRSTCCGGWGISLSLDEYLRLIGIDCTPELRRRLDTAFHIADNPSPERYALVTPKWDGHCPLQREDGLCMLQRECGEDMLPAVCRYYPRAPRTYPFFECSTSASCEHTLELLFESDAPIEFIETELSFRLDIPPVEDNNVDVDYYINMRKLAFEIITDRSLGFADRLRLLGEKLHEIDSTGFDKYRFGSDETGNSIRDAALLFDSLCEDSTTLQNYSDACRECSENRIEDRTLSDKLSRFFPKLDIYFEKLFVNHIFYKGFPCSFDQPTNHTLADEYAPLCAAYSLSIFVTAAALPDNPTLNDFVDIISSLFRVIEHSRFDTFIASVMKRQEITTTSLLNI